MGLVHSPKIVTDGLVLALDAGNVKSYPGSGTTWYDKSGNGNNGTLTNGPTFSDGSIVFDGVDDKVLFSSYNFPTTYSKFAVFYANDTSTRNILSSSSPVDHAVYLTSGTIFAGHNGSYRVVQTPISTGRWYTCAVTYDNTNNQIKLYLDGILKSTSTAGSLNTGGTYKIGEHSANQSFNGKIPVVQLYNRVLTQAEILQNYNTLKSRFGL